MLELQHITAAYHKGYPILSDVNLHVEKNEKVVLLGRNGAGKTTFAKAIFGLIPLISGEILIRGRNILSVPLEKYASLGMSYFMQGAPVFPQMSIKENLIITAGIQGNREFLMRKNELKELFPLLADSRIESVPAGSLSGGERTQLCLAMAIINKPGLLILDEPFAGLSPANASLILQILNDYQYETRASVLLIAQDRQMAGGFCKQHYVIREGKIIPDNISVFD